VGMRVMRTELEEFRPDLVLVWNGMGIPQAALRVVELSGLPLAYVVGEQWLGRMYKSDPFVRFLLPGEHGLRALWGRIARGLNHLPSLQVDASTRARAAVCWNSDATRATCGLPETLIPTFETRVYPGVPEPERWTGLERRPGRQPTIAFVGRVESEKGPDVAYRALAQLRTAHGIEARLLLAGRCKPAMRAELDALAAELGISGQVELLGALDKGGVGRLLERSDALVVPSTWDEPFGLVLLEGALARIPVVASRSGGMPEALREPQEALFFPIEDFVACAEALASTLDHSSSTEARIGAAYRRAEDLSFDRYIAEMGRFVAHAHASFSPVSRAIGSPV
jgi:glycosyltransferase involved in cell wall biosynthesis